jgi:hypothetical protein
MITRLAVLLLAALLWPAVLSAADFPGPLKVTFRTVDCTGATGLASVNVDHIARIQPYDCPNGRKLKQVLVRAASGLNEAYTIGEDEAPKLEAQIERLMGSRQKALEQARPIVIDR